MSGHEKHFYKWTVEQNAFSAWMNCWKYSIDQLLAWSQILNPNIFNLLLFHDIERLVAVEDLS